MIGGLIDVHPSAVPKEMLQEGAKWFSVNYQYAGQIMFKVFKQYKQFTMAAKRLSMANRAFSLENMDKKFEEILNKYLPKFEEQPMPVSLKLPKLKKVSKPTEAPKMNLPKLKKVK